MVHPRKPRKPIYKPIGWESIHQFRFCSRVDQLFRAKSGFQPYVYGESFDDYLCRLEQYFVLYNIPKKKQVPALISLGGPELYQFAKRIFAPHDPCCQDYRTLTMVLSRHLALVPNVKMERYQFRRCVQSPNQSVGDFVLQLQARLQLCQYAEELAQEALLEQFTVGVLDNNLRLKLLSDSRMTFNRACVLAIGLEPYGGNQPTTTIVTSSKQLELSGQANHSEISDEISVDEYE